MPLYCMPIRDTATEMDIRAQAVREKAWRVNEHMDTCAREWSKPSLDSSSTAATRGTRWPSKSCLSMIQRRAAPALAEDDLSRQMLRNAVCSVLLNSLKVTGLPDDGIIDLSLDNHLQVFLQGFLILPPKLSLTPSLYQDLLEASFNSASVWAIPVTAQAIIVIVDGMISLKCESIAIESALQQNGDPMVESWLPTQDIVSTICAMLAKKVRKAQTQHTFL